MILVPGQVPQSPVMTVSPVLVRVVAATAPKVLARPRAMGELRGSRGMAGRAVERVRKVRRVGARRWYCIAIELWERGVKVVESERCDVVERD